MKLLLKRVTKTPKFTLGELYIDGVISYFTCEDAVQGDGIASTVSEWKIKGESAIPYGTYKVIIDYSNHFKKHLPLLLDVPGFEGIRIHSGNTSEDTEGCILVGITRRSSGVANSRYAMDTLQPRIAEALSRAEPVTIEIV